MFQYRIEEIIMEMRFKEAAEKFLDSGADLLEFCPFPPASDRTAYEQLPNRLRQKLVAHGETCLNYPFPPILATDFMAFKRTGNRVNFEDVYFGRRYALNSLVLAECVENKGRFLDDIIKIHLINMFVNQNLLNTSNYTTCYPVNTKTGR